MAVVDDSDMTLVEEIEQFAKRQYQVEEVLVILQRLERVESICDRSVPMFTVPHAQYKDIKCKPVRINTMTGIDVKCAEKRMTNQMNYSGYEIRRAFKTVVIISGKFISNIRVQKLKLLQEWQYRVIGD
jgi:DNA-binding protein